MCQVLGAETGFAELFWVGFAYDIPVLTGLFGTIIFDWKTALFGFITLFLPLKSYFANYTVSIVVECICTSYCKILTIR